MMADKKPKDGGPAYPIREEWKDYGGAVQTRMNTGISVLDLFAVEIAAARILPGALATSENDLAEWAKRNYDLAQAMLTEREKRST